MKRGLGMSLFLVFLLGAMVAASAAFYWLAAAGGVVAKWILGGHPYVGTAAVNLLTLLLGVVMITASLLTVAERKWSAFMQDRMGPNRARLPFLQNRPFGGLPHLVADGIKMITKEDFVPARASKLLHALGPLLSFGPAIALFAVVPVGPRIRADDIPGIAWLADALGTTTARFPVALHVADDLEIGLLYLFGLASLAVYGTALAGWSSNNKLSLLGGVRASAQMISYEVALGLSLVGAMMCTGSLRLEQMTDFQARGLFGGALPAWGILLQPVGFLLFFAAGFAETKRAPFDMPEGESEIIGYFIEYSGLRFGLFMIAEFVEIVVFAGVLAAVFLGGYHLPDSPALAQAVVGADSFERWIFQQWGPFWLATIQAAGFLVKVLCLIWLQLAIRWTMPRFRYDQVQTLGWKILLPLALANIFVTGALILLDPSLDLLAIVGIAELLILGGITMLYPTPKPASVRTGAAGEAELAAAHGHGH